MDLRQIRRLSGLGRERVAARAGVTEATARVYELDRLAVAAETRAKLDRVYRDLLESLRSQVAAIGQWPQAVEEARGPLRRAR
jgi:transcriptional regulator with XRE-family HTH domain